MTQEQLSKLRALLNGPGEVAEYIRNTVGHMWEYGDPWREGVVAKSYLLDAQECLIKRGWMLQPIADVMRFINDASATPIATECFNDLPDAILTAWELDAEADQ